MTAITTATPIQKNTPLNMSAAGGGGAGAGTEPAGALVDGADATGCVPRANVEVVGIDEIVAEGVDVTAGEAGRTTRFPFMLN